MKSPASSRLLAVLAVVALLLLAACVPPPPRPRRRTRRHRPRPVPAAGPAPGCGRSTTESLKGAKYIDLTHTLTPSIPVWAGFGPAKFGATVHP